MLEMPVAPPSDFSWMQPGCIELQNVDWGIGGPPPTLGLGFRGIDSPAPEIIE